MKEILTKLKTQFPSLKFRPGRQFSWAPETSEIFYNASSKSLQGVWSLLHETGHALLEHKTYKADFNLLKLEIAAWEKARELAHDIGIELSEDHIQDCLDTYRDWLYKRSICPRCSTKCLQQDDYIHYQCFNCHMVWRVSSSRFCRAYRSTKNIGLHHQLQPAIFSLRH